MEELPWTGVMLGWGEHLHPIVMSPPSIYTPSQDMPSPLLAVTTQLIPAGIARERPGWPLRRGSLWGW